MGHRAWAGEMAQAISAPCRGVGWGRPVTHGHGLGPIAYPASLGMSPLLRPAGLSSVLWPCPMSGCPNSVSHGPVQCPKAMSHSPAEIEIANCRNRGSNSKSKKTTSKHSPSQHQHRSRNWNQTWEGLIPWGAGWGGVLEETPGCATPASHLGADLQSTRTAEFGTHTEYGIAPIESKPLLRGASSADVLVEGFGGL